MSRIGVGVIGTGDRAIGYLQRVFNAMTDEKKIRVVGVMDANAVRAREGGKDLQAERVFADHQALLEADGLDAVFIMTPDYTHAPLVVDALEAGKHVFCEKPMATTVEDCNRIAAAAEKAAGIFFAGHNMRFGPGGRTIKRIIKEGRLGQVRIVWGRRFVDGAKYWHRWHRSRAGSGGLLVHKGCHYMDQMNWYAGGRPRYVSAFGGQDVLRPRPDAPERCLTCETHCRHFLDLKEKDRSVRYFLNAEKEDGYIRDQCVWAPGADVFDNAFVNIEYDNGVRGGYQECHFASVTDLHTELGAGGEEGMIHLRRLSKDQFQLLYSCAKTRESETLPLDMEKPFGDEATIRAFVEDARKGQRPESDIEAGWDSAVVGIAAQAAAAERKIMEISPRDRTVRPLI